MQGRISEACPGNSRLLVLAVQWTLLRRPLIWSPLSGLGAWAESLYGYTLRKQALSQTR